MLINVNIIHIVDSEYSSWRVGLGIELANIVVSCCFIFLIHMSALALNHNN